MLKDSGSQQAKTAVQRVLWREYRKTKPLQKERGQRHSWEVIARALKYDRSLIYNIAHGIKPAPLKLIDKVNEVYLSSRRIHYPRAPLPKECWCGKIHQQPRSRKAKSISAIRQYDLTTRAPIARIYIAI